MRNSRERLARQMDGAVFDGRDPAAATEATGFNTAVIHRPAVVVAASSAEDVAAAHAVTARVMHALEPWSPGTSLVNFVGHAGELAQSRAWTPDTLERLQRVKRTVDPRNVFGGALAMPATAAAGAR